MLDVAWAQSGQGASGPPVLGQFLIFIPIIVIFYFLIFRPQQQKTKEHRQMLDKLKKNDEVVTSGGIYGKIVGLTDAVVTLEVAPNVRIRVSRPQVASLVKGEKAGNNKETKEP